MAVRVGKIVWLLALRVGTLGAEAPTHGLPPNSPERGRGETGAERPHAHVHKSEMLEPCFQNRPNSHTFFRHGFTGYSGIPSLWLFIP